jgi:hypothetical protein
VKLLTITAAAILFTLTAYAAKDIDRVWKTGTVLDSQSAKTFVETGTSTQARATVTTYGFGANATGSSETQINRIAVKDTQLLIVTEEFLYVVQESTVKGAGLVGMIANRKHGCRVIVNDPIRYSQERSALYLMDPDNKVCKMEIVRQERPVQTAQPKIP